MRVRVSAVIVNWNTKAQLLACLRSLEQCEQEEQNEVIVVDNGSTDGSQEAVRAEFPRVALVDTGANLGYAKACNIGIRMSRGAYVCLLNSDIVVGKDSLRVLADYLDHHPRIAMAGPLIRYPDGKVQDTCRKLPSLWNNLCEATGLHWLAARWPLFSGEHIKFMAHDRAAEVEGISGCFMFVRRRAIDEVGMMDERFFLYSEETDWCKRFIDAGWTIAFNPKAMAVHAHGASSKSDPLRFAVTQLESRLLYWKKHHTAAEVIGFRIIFFFRVFSRYLASALRRSGSRTDVWARDSARRYAARVMTLLVTRW